MLPVLPTGLVGSYAQPDWLIDRAKLAGRFPPRVRAKRAVAPRAGVPRAGPGRRDAARDPRPGATPGSTSSPTARSAARATPTTSRPRSRASTSTTRARPWTAAATRTRCPASSGPIRRRAPVEVRDVEFLRANTDRTDQDHRARARSRCPSRRRTTTTPTPSPRRWTTRRRCNAEIKDLFAAGADIVQIDEPYMQARPEPPAQYGLAALNARARRRHRHDRRAHLLRLRRDHPRAARRATRSCPSSPTARSTRSRSRPRSRASTSACSTDLTDKTIILGVHRPLRPRRWRPPRSSPTGSAARWPRSPPEQLVARPRLRHEVPAAGVRRGQDARHGRRRRDPAGRAGLIFFPPLGDSTFAVRTVRPCDAMHIRHHGRLIQPECGTMINVMNKCPTEGLS